MDIKQDPNAIPNFNSGGRIGELQPNEPEQAQSSVELDPTAGGDGAASEAPPDESPPDDGRSPSSTSAGAAWHRGRRPAARSAPGARPRVPPAPE
jgi:hypothetical protein